ncbi:Peroxidase 73 [Acorus calamus]|uniref:Peroxidase 73 n=1 Tax=Acorus calamus TaxID=4465 RepID=A0AAV9FBQ8_ACOCL|nr:Peroxidase 73 [Acorus calamus]
MSMVPEIRRWEETRMPVRSKRRRLRVLPEMEGEEEKERHRLRRNYYANVCPNVESIVRGIVNNKFRQTFVTVPATLRLFFHDCFVNGCDASVIIQSTSANTAEKDHPDNLSLAGDGFRHAAHTLGFSHCSKFSNRIYNFSPRSPLDPTLNMGYAAQLQGMCPRNVDPRIAINMDPTTPRTFDNAYFKNLQKGMGLFTSDQTLFVDPRSRPTVNAWAQNSAAFNQAFITAMTKMGRIGVKTGSQGNIRRNCAAFN